MRMAATPATAPRPSAAAAAAAYAAGRGGMPPPPPRYAARRDDDDGDDDEEGRFEDLGAELDDFLNPDYAGFDAGFGRDAEMAAADDAAAAAAAPARAAAPPAPAPAPALPRITCVSCWPAALFAACPPLAAIAAHFSPRLQCAARPPPLTRSLAASPAGRLR